MFYKQTSDLKVTSKGFGQTSLSLRLCLSLCSVSVCLSVCLSIYMSIYLYRLSLFIESRKKLATGPSEQH